MKIFIEITSNLKLPPFPPGPWWVVCRWKPKFLCRWVKTVTIKWRKQWKGCVTCSSNASTADRTVALHRAIAVDHRRCYDRGLWRLSSLMLRLVKRSYGCCRRWGWWHRDWLQWRCSAAFLCRSFTRCRMCGSILRVFIRSHFFHCCFGIEINALSRN